MNTKIEYYSNSLTCRDTESLEKELLTMLANAQHSALQVHDLTMPDDIYGRLIIDLSTPLSMMPEILLEVLDRYKNRVEILKSIIVEQNLINKGIKKAA